MICSVDLEIETCTYLFGYVYRVGISIDNAFTLSLLYIADLIVSDPACVPYVTYLLNSSYKSSPLVC